MEGMGNMNKKRAYGVVLAAITILLLILIICSFTKLYTKDKEFKMVYKVQAGEKLSDIARRFDVKPVEIVKANGHAVGEYIAEGRILVIPLK
jgi:LysM repeat protein